MSLQRLRGFFNFLLRPLKNLSTPCITVSQRNTMATRPPPYREENVLEKEMKRINGVSECPTDCLCSNNIQITYKNVRLLSQFMSQQTGRILPRSITKVCREKQRAIGVTIKRARTMGYLPTTESLPEYHEDPKLFSCSRAKTEMYQQIHRDRERTGKQKFNPYYSRDR